MLILLPRWTADEQIKACQKPVRQIMLAFEMF